MLQAEDRLGFMEGLMSGTGNNAATERCGACPLPDGRGSVGGSRRTELTAGRVKLLGRVGRVYQSARAAL